MADNVKQVPNTVNLVHNFIYMYHTNEWLWLPEYPDSVADTIQSNFAQTNALSRTAPVFTWSNAGPRRVQIQLNLHRDMIHDLNVDTSNFRIEVNEDYVDVLARKLQAIALPRYDATYKGVVPPMIALRLGEEIFIKGVVVGAVSIVYQKPIREDDKYEQVTLNFEVYETDAYEASDVLRHGSFRGITRVFEEGLELRNGR